MKRHIFYTMPVSALTKLVETSISLSEIFDKLDLCKTGPQYKTLKERIAELGLSTEHFIRPNKNGDCINRPISFYLIENCTKVNTSTLKKRLIKENLLKEECSECGSGSIWNNKFLSLQLDHINGIRSDNRLENLRILCPNCHSQTQTYSGKKNKRPKKTFFCRTCGRPCSKNGRCKLCFKAVQPKLIFKAHINWPVLEDLKRLVWEKPLTELALNCKASLNGLKRHCIKNNISLPPQGYWIRRFNGHSHEESLNSQAIIRPKARRMSAQEVIEAQSLRAQKKSFHEIGRLLGYAHTTIAFNLRKS